MKPTHGAVPYTGAMPIEATVDHLGPMTSTVLDNALLLDVIAGDDRPIRANGCCRRARLSRCDPRRHLGPADRCSARGVRTANSEKAVDEAVRVAARQLRKLGASVDEVSVPLHAAGTAIWLPIAAEGRRSR